MSVAIALKDNDRILLAVDCLCSATDNIFKLTNPNNYKIWKVKELDNSFMSACGTYRDVGIIRNSNLFSDLINENKEINMEYVQKNLVLNIYNKLKDIGFTSKDETDMDSVFLFAYKDVAYEISSDLAIFEIQDYIVKGSGRLCAIGSLESTVGQSPEIRLLKAVNAAAEFIPSVGYPIVIADTKKCEMIQYNEEDVKKILNTNYISRSSRFFHK